MSAEKSACRSPDAIILGRVELAAVMFGRFDMQLIRRDAYVWASPDVHRRAWEM